MSVRFARLRIAGFKSFAEAASVEILPGLTGIVGPNGCGKSNVVEALRWAMGESSARSLRGGEMDDLIFAGTAARPARNLAEVTLTLEEAVGIAPPPFHDQPELQISRRIERGSGSSYRVNGRDARARDVQTLFADLASGARSSAMVSQGRVASIVNARPEERRSILEEAAGITGLHARRHEAELKLRATEANLARAEDLRLQLEARLGELGTQSRQASRYREIAAGLREAEAGLLALLHARARFAVQQARDQGAATAAARAAAEQRIRAASLAEQQAEAAIAAPRDAESEARTALERQRIAAETLAREEARAAADADDARARFQQSSDDAGQASNRLEDARAALARIRAELESAAGRRQTHPDRLRAAEQALQDAQVALADATALLSEATAHETALQGRADRIARDREAAGARVSRLQALRSAARGEHQDAVAALPGDETLASLQTQAEEAAAEVEAARIAAEQASEARAAGARAADAARAASTEAARVRDAAERAATESRQRAARLEQERQGLSASLEAAGRNRVSDTDRARVEAARAEGRDALVAARTGLDHAESARIAAQRRHAEARQALSEAEGRHQQVEQALGTAGAALARAQAQHDRTTYEAEQAAVARVPATFLAEASERQSRAERALSDSRHALAGAETILVEAEQELATANKALADAQAEQARIDAEAQGLASALGSQAGQNPDSQSDAPGWRTLAETIPVPDGLESALAAVLAEGLSASLDDAAPSHFRLLAPISTRLPVRSVPLSALIATPSPLARLLDHAGLIEDAADGPALQPDLAPGQCLVTRTGDLWRWDGYSALAGSSETAAARGAARLEQRNRLDRARTRLDALGQRSGQLQQQAAAIAALHQERQGAAASARRERDDAEQALAAARTALSALAAREAAASARLDAIIPQREAAARLLDETTQALAAIHAEQATLPVVAQLRAAVEQAGGAERSALHTETGARTARQQAEARQEAASREHAALLSRHGEAESRLEALLPQSHRLDLEHAAAQAEAEAAAAHLAGLPQAAAARQALEQAVAALQVLERDETAARHRRRAADLARDHALAARTEILAQLDRQRSRIDALNPRLAALDEDYHEAAGALAVLEQEASGLADPGVAAAASAAARLALQSAREREVGCREARAQLTAEAAGLESAQQQLAAAQLDWERREAGARQDHEAALLRLEADRKAHETMQDVPLQVLQQRAEQAEARAGAEAVLHAAAAALAQASAALVHAQNERNAATAALAEAREAELRLQGRAEQADAILAQLLAETPNPPSTIPDDLSENAETGLRRRIARFTRERDEMGPVNLRADIESQEAQSKADTIAREREELETAIARLRGSIGHLNREGRARLVAVFQEVDRHFQSLFARMFNGGRAHLGLVGDDDPLLAGLEIYAQPPGKKLATLSLLSGGEQALTALSLIFAVFRCNPAPVCVLDEVDAPLDDANVGRFVALLSDMVAEAGTRFLVVTHHQLTMAHMDRLYGVTMQERGVSRLLSVDLAAATGMVTPTREPA